MRPVQAFIASMLFAAALAGCVTEEAEDPAPADDRGIPGLPKEYTRDFPRLRCLDGTFLTVFAVDWSNETHACNVETTVTNIGNEVTISVNPNNPDNVVAGAKDYTQPAAGQCVWDGIYATVDGGQTWKNQQLPGSNWKRLMDPMEPVTDISKHWCATDPVVQFGPDGEVYYSAMGYQCDPVSASPTGEDTLPQGGLNDWAFNCVQMYLLRSNDGGLTWPQITPMHPAGSYPVSFNDRQWMEVDQTTGDVYVGWIVFHGSGPATTVENWFFRSTDGGKSFIGPQIVSKEEVAAGQSLPAGGGQGTMITAGRDGEVYMSWNCGEKARLAVSGDHGESFAEPVEVPVNCDQATILYPSPTYARGEPRVPDAPWPAADDSDGPYEGNLYFVSRTDEWGRADIGFTRSTDGGATWTNLVQLNDDNETEAAQFFAAVSVNPHGVIDVVWYDQRRDPDHRLLDLYYTYSLDGGETWAPNARITEVQTDPQYSHHQNGMVFIGDYIDIDSSEDFAHPAWVDTRNGVADVYTAWIERPAYPIGFSVPAAPA